MEKILITGSNGFIGSHLIDYCLEKQNKVFALDRPSSSFNNLTHYTDGKLQFSENEKQSYLGENILISSNNQALTFLECDIKDDLLLEKIIIDLKPNYIFHFAAQPYINPSWEDPVDTIQTNVIGTINIFEPIKKYKIVTRVLLACTSGEFGSTAEVNRPLKEGDPLLALHPYGISKIAVELLSRQYALNFGIEAINVRFFNQTGIRRINDAPSDFIRKIAQIELELMEPIIEVGNLSPYRDFTDIKDSLEAIWLAATKGKPGETYHICSKRKINIRDILNTALSFSSKEIEVKENVSSKLRKTDEDVIIGDNYKIREELGWEITIPIEKTLKDMFDFWLEYYKKKKK
jgi:GDP-4-dehydro-6-deoxy-D-mannose reductase